MDKALPNFRPLKNPQKGHFSTPNFTAINLQNINTGGYQTCKYIEILVANSSQVFIWLDKFRMKQQKAYYQSLEKSVDLWVLYYKKKSLSVKTSNLKSAFFSRVNYDIYLSCNIIAVMESFNRWRKGKLNGIKRFRKVSFTARGYLMFFMNFAGTDLLFNQNFIHSLLKNSIIQFDRSQDWKPFLPLTHCVTLSKLLFFSVLAPLHTL